MTTRFLVDTDIASFFLKQRFPALDRRMRPAMFAMIASLPRGKPWWLRVLICLKSDRGEASPDRVVAQTLDNAHHTEDAELDAARGRGAGRWATRPVGWRATLGVRPERIRDRPSATVSPGRGDKYTVPGAPGAPPPEYCHGGSRRPVADTPGRRSTRRHPVPPIRSGEGQEGALAHPIRRD